MSPGPAVLDANEDTAGKGFAELAEQNWLRMKGENQFRQLALDLIVPFRKSVWLLVAWTVRLGLAQAGGGSVPPH